MDNYNKCFTCKHTYTPDEISFVDLLNLYDKILIPKVQRDYAQGRRDKKASDVRKGLLNDIFNNNSVKFDFIFGTKEIRKEGRKTELCFIPLDGQQRLTTLFLLYLYGMKTNKLNLGHDLSKFTYDTRRASKDFSLKLVESSWTDFKMQKPNEYIRNSVWFQDYWQYDPTVASMLTMLDDIHEHPLRNVYDFSNLNKIRFYFFDLDEHNLSESLYLKMNSRGKPLTAFEIFKAEIDVLLPLNVERNPFLVVENQDSNVVALTSFKEKWQYCIDKQWTDFFWTFKENYLMDFPFMRFVCNMLSGYWAAFVNEKNQMDENGSAVMDNANKPVYILGNDGARAKNEHVETDITFNTLLSLDLNNENNYVSFEIYRNVVLLDNAFYNIAKVLCDCYIYPKEIAENSKPSWDRGFELFVRVNPNADYKQRAIFFAFTQYNQSGYENNSYKEWMRFAWNIAENNVSSKEEYIFFCKMIGKLSANSNDIQTFLCQVTIEDFKKNISAFASDQVEEEVMKSKLMITSENFEKWKNLINDAESHELFRGCIRFLLSDHKDISMNEVARFESRLRKCQKWFNRDGVSQPFKNTLLRAFISSFTSWEQLLGIEYDNTGVNWRKIFKDSFRKPALEKLMDFDNLETLINRESLLENTQKHVHEDLYKSELLNAGIVNGCKLNTWGNKYILYPYNAKADWKKYVIADNRNRLLVELSVETNQKLPGVPFYRGWNINFKWKDKEVLWTWHDELKFGNKEISIKEINDKDTLIEKINSLIN